MSCTAQDSHPLLPQPPITVPALVPAEVPDADAALSPASSQARARARPRLELVMSSPDWSASAAAPATHGIFDDEDDEYGAAPTQIYVPIVVEAPKDLESQRKFDEFWLTKPALAEPPAVFLPVFPKVPLLQRTGVRVMLLVAAAIAIVALFMAGFAFVASSMRAAEAAASASD